MDSTSRPALVLATGRGIGLAVSFAIGIVLARVFDPEIFGIYKQFFLVYATLYGVMQLGMAESLYYFVPRAPDRTGRFAGNAMATLALAGAGCTLALHFARPLIAGWLNPEVATYAVPLGLFLTFMLMATVLEIVQVSRKRHLAAAVTYAVSDIIRTLMFIVPALLLASLRAVVIGAVIFAALRLAATVAAFWREYRAAFRLDLTVWRQQLGYALPFALAVGIEVVLINYHQYVVAARFDAATFAVYAIGCLQIPLYELIVTSTLNVLMVRMAGTPPGRAALALWHDAVSRMAFLIFPLAALLAVGAHHLIVGLFTATYAASAPIFVLWVMTMVPAVLAVDAVLRVYGLTRFLVVMNVVRFVCVAGLIGGFLSAFGLRGAVLVTLAALAATKLLGLVRVARLMRVGLRDVLPWRQLATSATLAAVAVVPVRWLQVSVDWPPLVTFIAGSAAYVGTYGLLSYACAFASGIGPAALATQAEPCALQADQT